MKRKLTVAALVSATSTNAELINNKTGSIPELNCLNLIQARMENNGTYNKQSTWNNSITLPFSFYLAYWV